MWSISTLENGSIRRQRFCSMRVSYRTDRWECTTGSPASCSLYLSRVSCNHSPQRKACNQTKSRNNHGWNKRAPNWGEKGTCDIQLDNRVGGCGGTAATPGAPKQAAMIGSSANVTTSGLREADARLVESVGELVHHQTFPLPLPHSIKAQ